MLLKFKPFFTLTSGIVQYLKKIEAIKEKVLHLPLTPQVITSLRETAKIYTTHYSTMIEGNRLDPAQINAVLKHVGHFPGREREEQEVKGYYVALTQVEKWAQQKVPLTEDLVKTIHALVMSGGKISVKPTPYRDGQNVIRDGRTHTIVYLPPEATDVPHLMKELIDWLNENSTIPAPVLAAIAHYQFATIHPYYDGNGRTARLLTTFILHQKGYDLKGLYSLEEYYARDLGNYYQALTIGPSHNYYMGRAGADITPWVLYFIRGMATACNNLLKHLQAEQTTGSADQISLMRTLDPKQRKALTLFQKYAVITSNQIAKLFEFKPRTASKLCNDWVKEEFLEVVDQSKKGRKYKLANQYEQLITKI